MPQRQVVPWYFRADADHDISGDPMALSLDGVTWVTAGVSYVAVGALPPGPAAVHVANPPAAGFAGYWWVATTGPGQALPLAYGVNEVQGRITDNPYTPYFEWRVYVDSSQ